MASTISAGTTTTTALSYSADTSGVLQLQTNGTTTAVTIDNSQNVGIGTASPTGKLNVNATYVSDTTTQMRISDNTGTSLDFGGTGGGVKWLNSRDTGSGAAYPLAFQTGGTERGRFDTSGNLLVGTTTVSGSNERFNVTGANAGSVARFNNTNATPYGVYSLYTSTPNNTASQFFLGADGTATRFYVASNGGIYNFSANNSNLSDRREKTNFAPAKSYLNVICAIPVQTYNYIDQNMKDDAGLTLGVIAQDVQAVAPELVTESDWSTEKDGSKMRLSIYQTDMQYALMKCIQELSAQVTTLQSQVTALKG